MKMPQQKPGKSKQDYGTPPEFLRAIERKLHIEQFMFDLAADNENSVSQFGYYDEEDNSLIQDWSKLTNGWNWCNPPYADIEPWVSKAAVSMPARIAMLLPASVGSNWWRDWVDDRAHVLLLNGRLTFVGETAPYPKDCALLLYNTGVYGGYEVWNWRNEK